MCTKTHFGPLHVLHQPIWYLAHTQLVVVCVVIIIDDIVVVLTSLCLVFYPYSIYICVCWSIVQVFHPCRSLHKFEGVWLKMRKKGAFCRNILDLHLIIINIYLFKQLKCYLWNSLKCQFCPVIVGLTLYLVWKI